MPDTSTTPGSYELLNIIYSEFVATSHAPSVMFLAEVFGLPFATMAAKLQALAAAHLLVLEPGNSEIRMAMPFSAVPTRFNVDVRGRSYWANCAWDALGVAAALASDAIIDTVCAASGRPEQIVVSGGKLRSEGQVVHFALPRARWWDDVIET